MEQVDWVMLLSPVGVVMAMFAVFVPFFLSMFNKIYKLSKQIEDALRDFGEKLGEVQTEMANTRTEFVEKLGEVQSELANVRTEMAEVRTEMAEVRTEMANTRTEFVQKLGEMQTELANVRTEFVEKLGEVQVGLSEDFADLRVDVARLEGALAGAGIGIGNAEAANPGRNVSDIHPRTDAPRGESAQTPAREEPLAASSPRGGEAGRHLD